MSSERLQSAHLIMENVKIVFAVAKLSQQQIEKLSLNELWTASHAQVVEI